MKENIYVSINMKATGRRIKELRKARQLTVEELSEYFHTSPQAIYKWQSGKTLPTLDNMMVLGRLLQTKIEDIVVLGDDESFFYVLNNTVLTYMKAMQNLTKYTRLKQYNIYTFE